MTDERGNLVWISAARPGRSSEVTTARQNKISARLRDAGLGALADLGFVGLDDAPRRPGDRHRPQSDPGLSANPAPEGAE
ncbi:hypothetical protein [Streptomyces sp. NBC_00154]|uniref:hypothetical protein n=1 Tax=Streptomyces sp. NBC_00154 TaxID=2975670 RepID=UPI002257C741|nr:hypothetical protein [Streptomyces sp. NBC_00154]MCX5317703.1 hypothetical protein [Streptomyces sp. NBC_00154]